MDIQKEIQCEILRLANPNQGRRASVVKEQQQAFLQTLKICGIPPARTFRAEVRDLQSARMVCTPQRRGGKREGQDRSRRTARKTSCRGQAASAVSFPLCKRLIKITGVVSEVEQKEEQHRTRMERMESEEESVSC